MSKRFLIIIALSALLLTGTACHYVGIRGNGHLVKKEIKIGDFNKLEVSGIFTVKIFIGGNARLKLITESNLIKHIKIRQKNGKLIIYSTRNLSPRRKLLVLIKTPSLKSVEASGVTKVLVKKINSPKFRVDLSGASELRVIGRTGKLTADVSGASNLNAKHLIADIVEIDCSGASRAIVNARGKLIADASGASSIIFAGNPKIVKADASGISKIKRLTP